MRYGSRLTLRERGRRSFAIVIIYFNTITIFWHWIFVYYNTDVEVLGMIVGSILRLAFINSSQDRSQICERFINTGLSQGIFVFIPKILTYYISIDCNVKEFVWLCTLISGTTSLNWKILFLLDTPFIKSYT